MLHVRDGVRCIAVDGPTTKDITVLEVQMVMQALCITLTILIQCGQFTDASSGDT